MEAMAGIIGSMQKNMMTSLSDEVCKHTIEYSGKIIVKEYQKMKQADGSVICPRCACEADTKRMVKENDLYIDSVGRRKNKAYFDKESMIADITVKRASLENYETKKGEMTDNKKNAEDYIQSVANGDIANLFIQGKPGVGKSHLAYSICLKLNDGNRKVMFVSINELLRRILDTIRNKDATDSEQAIIARLIAVDILVLDDIGAEVGNIDNHGAASDFVSKVIFAVLDGRQGKCTIFTTNLTGAKIKQIYDMRTVSRMFRDFKHIVFKETNDYRKVEIPF